MGDLVPREVSGHVFLTIESHHACQIAWKYDHNIDTEPYRTRHSLTSGSRASHDEGNALFETAHKIDEKAEGRGEERFAIERRHALVHSFKQASQLRFRAGSCVGYLSRKSCFAIIITIPIPNSSQSWKANGYHPCPNSALTRAVRPTWRGASDKTSQDNSSAVPASIPPRPKQSP